MRRWNSRRRVAARDEALRQVEQERGQALLGAHAAQQHHHALVAHDLAAHHLVELALQAGTSRASCSARVGDHADLAVLQRDRRRWCAARCRCRPCPRSRPPCGSRSPGRGRPPAMTRGLEEAAAHRVDRLERVAGAVQRLAALHALARCRRGRRARSTSSAGQAAGQAQLAQVARGAARADRGDAAWRAGRFGALRNRGGGARDVALAVLMRDSSPGRWAAICATSFAHAVEFARLVEEIGGARGRRRRARYCGSEWLVSTTKTISGDRVHRAQHVDARCVPGGSGRAAPNRDARRGCRPRLRGRSPLHPPRSHGPSPRAFRTAVRGSGRNPRRCRRGCRVRFA